MPNFRQPNQLRIIGGRFKGRKLSFPDIETLRPTGDRIRETLFNWLAPVIKGATCLDLFAGSGALGFEAISRGARHVVMCDESSLVVKQLKINAELLAIENIEIIQGQAPACVSEFSKCFDIVFLDPPFHKNLLEKSIYAIESCELLNPQGLLYIEAEISLEKLPLSEKWQLLKSKKSGNVAYYLARYLGSVYISLA